MRVGTYYARVSVVVLINSTPYSAHMSPENTHNLMGFYMEVLILRRYTLVHGFCCFKLFPIGCMGLIFTGRLVLHERMFTLPEEQ